MSFEKTEEQISAALYLLRLFQRILGDEATAEVFAAIDLDLVAEAYACLLEAEQESVDEIPQLGAFCTALTQAEANLEQTRQDYDRLFIGPVKIQAPPWESVYRDKQRLLMTRTTLEVRHTYSLHGYKLQSTQNVPDDHIATELDFLALLAEEALNALSAGDEALCQNKLDSIAAFIEKHLGVWLPDFADAVHEAAPDSLYDYSLALLQDFIARLRS